MRFDLLLSIALIILGPSANAFAASSSGLLRPFFSASKQRSTHVARATASLKGDIVVTSTPPSWDELSAAVQRYSEASESPKPLVTLYRDTNGWCPFCERIWVVLRAKGISYEEQLISLQNKPDWYKALVPTSLVPAVLFHGDGETNERRIVWESSDILKALEEEFPDTPKMVHDSPLYEEAVQLNEDLTLAGLGFVYAGRNGTLTEEEKLSRKDKFQFELDRLNAFLEKQQTSGSGDFCIGDFSAVDALMIPTLERWRVQLPITNGIDIEERDDLH